MSCGANSNASPERSSPLPRSPGGSPAGFRVADGSATHPASPDTIEGGGQAMDSQQLRSLQAPLKDRYRTEPGAAQITLHAEGRLGEEAVACSVETGRALVEAGLHPATGGDGTLACSGDMLLQALVACAGVTLRAVATALDLPLNGGAVRAEGDLDFRGTLGVDRAAPV